MNPRLREVLSALVRHLHALAREVKLTEEEFQAAVGYIVTVSYVSPFLGPLFTGVILIAVVAILAVAHAKHGQAAGLLHRWLPAIHGHGGGGHAGGVRGGPCGVCAPAG